VACGSVHLVWNNSTSTLSEWVSSFLAANQHIEGHFSITYGINSETWFCSFNTDGPIQDQSCYYVTFGLVVVSASTFSCRQPLHMSITLTHSRTTSVQKQRQHRPADYTQVSHRRFVRSSPVVNFDSITYGIYLGHCCILLAVIFVIMRKHVCVCVWDN